MIELLALLGVLVLLCWIISLTPLPATSFPLRNILYVIVGIVAIVYLLRFAGLA